jgi:hypothetical protein
MLAIALGICALTLGALGYAFVRINEAGATLAEHTRQFAGDRAQESAHLAVEKQLGETETKRAELQGFVLGGSDDTVAFLSEIDQYAAGIGITLSTDTLEVVAQKSEPYDVLMVTISMDGSEAGVLRMLSLLEAWPYHGYVASATFERATAPGESPMHATVQFAVTIEKDT